MSKSNHFDSGKGDRNRSASRAYWNGYQGIDWHREKKGDSYFITEREFEKQKRRMRNKWKKFRDLCQ
jgi:hypothetical protein